MELETREQMEVDTNRSLERLESFCHQIAQGIDSLTFEGRQKLLQLVVERVKVENEVVTIETVIPGFPNDRQLRARRPELVEGHEQGRVEPSPVD